MFTLGQAPDTLKVVLVAGADFVSTLRRKDNSTWPTNSSLVLAFTDAADAVTDWPADLTGAVATWNVDLAVVDTLVAKRPRVVRLWYVEGDLRLLWAQGEIDVRRQ